MRDNCRGISKTTLRAHRLLRVSADQKPIFIHPLYLLAPTGSPAGADPLGLWTSEWHWASMKFLTRTTEECWILCGWCVDVIFRCSAIHFQAYHKSWYIFTLIIWQAAWSGGGASWQSSWMAAKEGYKTIWTVFSTNILQYSPLIIGVVSLLLFYTSVTQL